MGFKKLVAPSLTDLFVNELKRMILSGDLQIGDKLPPERQLAEEMNVSLAVIHGGITRLTDLGFLNAVPRQGVFVADYIRNGNMNTMKEIMEYTDDNLSFDILEPIINFRRSIELKATLLACENGTEESFVILSNLVRRAEDPEQSEHLPEIGFQFHHEIAVAGKNIYYPMIMQTFKPLYILFYQMTIEAEPQAKFAEPLTLLLSAIKKKDTKDAALLINKSIDHWIDILAKNYPAG